MQALDFIQRAMLGGMGIAFIAGPLGAMIVWRRMANFGDALGHSMLLGVCFALLLNIHLYIGLMAITLLFAIVLASLSSHKQLSQDTLLSVLSQTILAVGLIMATSLQSARIDLLSYLYGDILSIQISDLVVIYSVVIITGGLLLWLWRPALSMIIHEDLARVEGVPVLFVKWMLVFITAVIFAIAIKLVGALLITALLVIPASAARKLSKTPEQMAIFASIIGILSVVAGIFISQWMDCPTGPAIVSTSFLFFIVSLILGRFIRTT
jgi:zinc transport system permease protein